ncbi:bifunctional ADP-dependent NAD(P)H-hydrate dehydratase/NAD(P)H-hydrate epimerase [Cellulosimicrobium aquatile]|uniref:bifunctional ADP-dependent NAD(P)H-hydrate dehydratase/NAD(P)H-hydrate epimerase n=1 Tax=Cellulosimicrobium aquatile TaxID=1612203 RepID=UPI001459936B|nr:bifunctional ADP-dependent NAD(P)H-hydrate dehydratase/NAD(P)H-hydrate epimerase [Cellulosimicrobium aquatile]NMF27623.1 bifunctional ADP-dependent (S)-NAD(P)H-hydrate dehydratase/NAD(P)H-hydrate epimerase [Cellulosimicrobium aquatile]
MIEAWSVADVRAAEEPLLVAGVPLMERASFALATVVARDLARRRSVALPDGGRRDGRVTGARAVLLVGSGNNGGDTLYAGAYLARRGVEVLAVLTGEHAHAGGLAALRDAGGRVEVLVGSADGTAHGDGHDDRHRDHLDPHVADRVAGQAARADVVLDGLVGIGARGALRGVAADLVERLAAVLDGDPAHHPEGPGRPWVVAVDAPSGIGVDDGTVPGPVLRADRTVTFGAAKPGLLLPPATHLAGYGAVVDIGLRLGAPVPDAPVPDAPGLGAPGPGVAGPDAPAPDRGKTTPVVRRLEPADVAALWSVPGATDHKYTRGVVGVVAGTPTFPGAAVLVTTAAVRTGPGMVRYGGPDDATRAVLAARPEVVLAAGRVQSWVLGPGVPAVPGPGDDLVDDGGQHERVRTALAAATATDATTTDATTTDATTTGATPERVPAVVDAGALSLLPERCPPSVVLTPHAGELATLLRARGDDVARTDVEAEPLRWARRAHDATGATVLLKGSATVVVGPEGAWSQADAPAWLATAGAGDVLAGILGTLLAAHAERVVREPGLAARLAAAAAVVHGLAAERANPGGPVAALDVADAVPGVVAELLAAR